MMDLLPSEIETAKLDLCLAKSPERLAVWAERYGEDLCRHLENKNDELEEQISAMEIEVDQAVENETAMMQAANALGDDLADVIETLSAAQQKSLGKVMDRICEIAKELQGLE